MSAVPDVTSFAVGAAQRFVLMGCDGVWKVHLLSTRVLSHSRYLSTYTHCACAVHAHPPSSPAPLACHGPSLRRRGARQVFDGQRAIEFVHERLPKLDARRAQLIAQLNDPAAVSALTRDALGALRGERDAACEAGLLRELLHEAVTVRHAKDNCTVLLVRF